MFCSKWAPNKFSVKSEDNSVKPGQRPVLMSVYFPVEKPIREWLTELFNADPPSPLFWEREAVVPLP